MRIKNDITGKLFVRLTAILPVGKSKHGSTIWRCKCSCGSDNVDVVIGNLTSGSVKSCGCLRIEKGRLQGLKATTHGMCKTRVYHIWVGMHSRCKDLTHKSYSSYGGKGVVVAESWNTFEQFFADMGNPPTVRHTLDRKNSTGNYTVGNCRWALPIEQMNNMSRNVFLEFEGQRKTVTMWARDRSMKAATLRYRLKAGWSVAQALEKEIKR